jgi:hypothetical protein
VNAKAGVYDADNNVNVGCFLSGPSGDLDESDPSDFGGSQVEIPIALMGTVSLPTPGRLTLACRTADPGEVGRQSKIVAVSVGNLH